MAWDVFHFLPVFLFPFSLELFGVTVFRGVLILCCVSSSRCRLLPLFSFATDLGPELSNFGSTTEECPRGGPSRATNETTETRQYDVVDVGGNWSPVCVGSDPNFSRVIWRPNVVSESEFYLTESCPGARKETEGCFLQCSERSATLAQRTARSIVVDPTRQSVRLRLSVTPEKEWKKEEQ